MVSSITISDSSSSDPPSTEPLLSDSSRLPPRDNAEDSLLSKFLNAAIQGIRIKFAIAGFIFGSVVETLYVSSIRHGYVKIVPTAAASADETGVVADGSTGAAFSIRITNVSDAFFYEMSYLFVDLLFLVYVALLARGIMKNHRQTGRPNAAFQVAVNSANWSVGMVLGLTVAVGMVVGFRVVLQERLWQVVGSLGLGVALCFVGFLTACEFENLCREDSKVEGEQKERQDSRNGSSYIAHIV